MKKYCKKLLLPGLAVLLIATAVFAVVYVNDYYAADVAAIAADVGYDVTELSDSEGNLIFAPEEAHTGFIFYPGGKVDHLAYAPLMERLSDAGVLCVVVEMPCRLAVLDVNAAEEIRAQYPEIDTWYIGGHSLGGSMAASHLADNTADYAGLVLLASYSTADLSGSSLRVLSLYGSEDGVLNLEKYEENIENLPTSLTEGVIEGGCHAYFGMYGAQEGDGTPRITAGEQISVSADAILALMGR